MVDFKKDKAKKVDFLRVKDSRTGDIRKVISPSKFEVGLPDSDFSKGMKVQGPIEIVEVLSPSTTNRLYVTDNDLYWSGTKMLSGTAGIESVTAGVGLSGGGSSGAISLALDVSELTALGATAATSDFAVIQDVTDDSTKKVLISNIPITPAGSDTQIQFNDAGSLGASSAFTFDDTTVELYAASPTITVRRTNNNQNSDINFESAAGVVGAKLRFSGSATNDLVLSTFTSSALKERLRINSGGTDVSIVVTGSLVSTETSLPSEFIRNQSTTQRHLSVVNSGSGDSTIEFYKIGGWLENDQSYAIGIDYSDSEKFKIAHARGTSEERAVFGATFSAGTRGDLLEIDASSNAGTVTLNRNDTSGSPQLVINQQGDGDVMVSLHSGYDNKGWAIGYDESDPQFEIAYGTNPAHAFSSRTTHLAIDEIGAVTKPVNPSFLATLGSTTSTIPTDQSELDVVFGTEIFDLNADYNTSTGVFTAPVAGKYLLAVELLFQSFDTGATYYSVNIVTSNRTYCKRHYPNNSSSEPLYYPQQTTVIADMDANDTAKVTVQQGFGTAQTEVFGSSQPRSWFAGSLLN